MTSPTHQPRHLLPAWGLSFSIHAIVMGVAIALLHDLPRPQPPVLRMEFLLTDSTSVADPATPQETPTATESPSPAAASSSRTTSASSMHAIEQRSPSEPSIVQRMVNPVPPATAAQRDLSPSVTANDSVPVVRPAPIEQQLETLPPVTESSRPATMNTAQAIERPLLTASAQSPARPVTESAVTNLQESTPPSSLATSESAQHAAETASSFSSDSAHSIAAPPNDHAHASQPIGQPSVTASHTVSQTSDASPPPSHLDSNSPPSAPQQTLVMNHPPIARTIPSRPDYGWLKDLLKRRIMSLQAYPRLARMQGWEGVVVLKARIKSDGSLLDAVVAESSGYASLDEDALTLMRHACPLRLPHDLGQSHIEVLVPVHYRLE